MQSALHIKKIKAKTRVHAPRTNTRTHLKLVKKKQHVATFLFLTRCQVLKYEENESLRLHRSNKVMNQFVTFMFIGVHPSISSLQL